ncbi:MAG: hypothetical protein PWP23_1501 [Candidatus Sumerlaeota bacterium]|nr:hypothetical protein [Candidatus Sumerlaeota bacterium]
MEFGSRFKGLFRRSFQAGLENEETREETLDAICAQMAELRQANPDKPEVWQKPLQEALEVLGSTGDGAVLAWRKATRAFPDEPSFRRELIQLQLPKAHFPPEDIPLLRDEAIAQSRNISLWQRLLEEARYLQDDQLLAASNETLVLTLSRYFPPGGESTWYDVETEAQARSMFFNRLDDCTDRIVSSQRDDERALELFEIAYAHFPNRAEIAVRLAHFHRLRGASAPHSLGLILQALLFAPDDQDLQRTAARLLVNRPGHEQEGLDLMLQVYEANPNDASLIEDLTHCLSKVGTLQEQHVEIVQARFRQSPDDPAAVALLAGFYSRCEDVSDEAHDVLAKATELFPEETRYALALAKQHLRREQWQEASRVLEEIDRREGANPDLLEALAICYSKLGDFGERAVEVIKAAIATGLDNESVHDAFCGYLFHTSPDAPESIEQFRETHRRFPQASWATLGLVRHMVQFEDFDRAQEKLFAFLQGGPVVAEAASLAARIVSADPKRQRIRQYLTLPPETAKPIFEEAAQLAPESLLILTALARYRLNAGLRDARTAELLTEICKRDQSDMEMRLYRADILFEIGEIDAALDLYRDILARSREASGSVGSSGTQLLPDQHAHVHSRLAASLLASPERIEQTDYVNILEAAMSPGAERDLVVHAALWVVQVELIHPLAQPVVELALAIQSDNEELELGLAKLKLQRGSARSALHLVLKRVELLRFEKPILDLLERVVETVQPDLINEELTRRILQFNERRRYLPDRVAFLIARLLVASGRDDLRFLPVLERAASLKSPPPDVLLALDRCRRQQR